MKPFVKWAGGKTRLLKEIEQRLPADFDEWVNVTYVEPFVGGGSMLLHMLNKYSNITRAVINDINPVLMKSYLAIKNDPSSLIEDLKELKREYIRLEIGTLRDDFFYNTRKEYNEMDLANEKKIALFIFLNHTCFNGLYRENRMGLFNVPHGKYKNPVVFEESNLLALHDILKKVDIKCGDFANLLNREYENNTFIYIDPPYRPINAEMTMFTEYDKSGFTDADQRRLKLLCDTCTEQGYKIMVSNSDSYDGDDSYFENLYNEGYHLDRITVTRLINPYNARNRKPQEIIITNY